MANGKKKVFICLPISDKNRKRQEKRADELATRLRKEGFDAVNPFDISRELDEKFLVAGNAPCHDDYLAEDFRELLSCDGILLDADAKSSDDCNILTAVAQSLALSRKFAIFHTIEQWEHVKKHFII